MLRRLRVEALWRCLWIFPLNHRKVVCCNFYGRGYTDNLAPIVDELLRRDPDLTVVWLVSDYLPQADFPDSVQQVRIESLRSVFHQRTAGVWIDDCRKRPGVRQRRGQRYIQTWHGFPLKRVESDAANQLDRRYLKAAKRDSRMVDVMVSNSS